MGNASPSFASYAEYLQHPIVLAGFALFVVVGLFRAFLASDKLAQASRAASGKLLFRIARYGFVLAIVVILLGFGFAFFREHNTAAARFAPNKAFEVLVASHERERTNYQGQLRQRDEELAALRATLTELKQDAQAKDAPPGLGEALLELQQGRPDEAKRLLAQTVERRAAEGEAATATGQAATAEAARAARQLGALAYLDNTDEALAAYRRAAELDPRDIWTWIFLGRLEARAGDLARAAEAFDNALRLARETQNERDVSVALNGIGDVRRAQGDLTGALAAYEDGLKIAEALAAADPSNREWQHDRSVSLDRIGDVRSAQGDLAGGLAAYEDGLKIAEALAAADPSNREWQRDRSVSLDRIGDVRSAQGDLGGALAAYEGGLKIREALAAVDPSNRGWQRDRSVSLNGIGDVRRAQGDHAGALAAYEDGLKIREALAAADPRNSGGQRDRSVSLERIADARRAQGDLAGALASYEKGIEVRERLAAADPTNSEWQRDLSISFERVALAREARNDIAGAGDAFRQALGISSALAGRDPGNIPMVTTQVVHLAGLARCTLKLDPGRAVEAGALYDRALAVLRPLAAAGRLDAARQGWIEWLEQEKAALLSTSPDRDDTILRRDPFAD